jgi:hypothetical protein
MNMITNEFSSMFSTLDLCLHGTVVPYLASLFHLLRYYNDMIKDAERPIVQATVKQDGGSHNWMTPKWTSQRLFLFYS